MRLRVLESNERACHVGRAFARHVSFAEPDRITECHSPESKNTQVVGVKGVA